MKELLLIQTKLKAPKNQLNKFGNYNYRSCEDILEAVKPLLEEQKCTLTISDDIIMIGARIYVKAIATFTNESGEKESTSAFAREEDTKKGMDSAQITGSASSYARKYALNGLFCIDDNKDNDHSNEQIPSSEKKPDKKTITVDNSFSEEAQHRPTVEDAITKATDKLSLQLVWANWKEYFEHDKWFKEALSNRKHELKIQ